VRSLSDTESMTCVFRTDNSGQGGRRFKSFRPDHFFLSTLIRHYSPGRVSAAIFDCRIHRKPRFVQQLERVKERHNLPQEMLLNIAAIGILLASAGE